MTHPDQFSSLESYLDQVGREARDASKVLRSLSGNQRQSALVAMANAIRAARQSILHANDQDIEAAKSGGLDDAMIDRLRLDPNRIEAIAKSVEAIAQQDDPVGRSLASWAQPNGLKFQKVSVPIGVIGMIYESRPNVTADAAALCLKSGNAVILRGGSEAVHSNQALFSALQSAYRNTNIPSGATHLLQSQDRAAVGQMLGGLSGFIDLIIPRGGKGLVERVQTDARVPVLAHLEGLNHTYVHADADLDMAMKVVLNAKMRRTGICGATETVLVEAAIASLLIPGLAQKLGSAGCEIRGDGVSQSLSDLIKPASDQDFATEHLAPIVNMAVVQNIDDALDHIARYGSGHTDAIITDNRDAADHFLNAVDSAIVLHNASTQFADGGEFGFGAEIGIATGRLHARGPVGAQHLTSYKYQVVGNGTIRA